MGANNNTNNTGIPAIDENITIPITRDEYIKYRLKDQIRFFEVSSQKNKKHFYLVQMLQLILSSLITVLALLDETSVFSITIAIVGASVSVLTAMQNLYKFQEIWIKHRGTTEKLKTEKFLYASRVGPYQVENKETDPFPLLVERVEEIINRENEGWAQSTKEQKPTNSTGE